MQEFEIKKITNFPIDSNCFIIRHKKINRSIIVDPAQGSGSSIEELIVNERLILDFIVITHEHFDHISSVECLRSAFNAKLISSVECSYNIVNSKRNLSLFYDQKGFSCSSADILIDKSGFELTWMQTILRFFLTPGHSEGGICFSIEDNLFTGDTILNTHSLITKLPGGDKEKLWESITLIKRIYNDKTRVFPGHGETFELSEFNFMVLK